MHSIAKRLKEERKRLGMSQTKLCELMGITRKTLFSYETGERSPNVLFLAALYDHDFDVDYILKGKHGRLQPSVILKVQQAAETAFRLVQSAGISVTPAQFGQMLVSLLDGEEKEMADEADADSKKNPENEVHF